MVCCPNFMVCLVLKVQGLHGRTIRRRTTSPLKGCRARVALLKGNMDYRESQFHLDPTLGSDRESL